MASIFKMCGKYLIKNKYSVICYGVLCLTSSMFSMISPYISGNFIDYLIVADNISKIYRYCFAFFGLFVFNQLIGYIVNRVYIKMQTQMGYDLNSDVIRHIQHLPVSFLKKQNMAYLNQRVNNDSNQVITFCINIVQGILINSLKLLLSIFVLVQFSCNITLLFIAIICAYTYYMKVPSVLSNAERNMDRESIPYQELKIEFILQPEKWEYERRTGENIFAVNSSWNYQILPLNYLFADKLTTLGCNTIGVQNERLDEQVKQFYDIMMLSRNCISEMQCSVVKEKYLKRAEQEWNTRKITLGSTLEGRDYEPKYIVEDVEKQLLRYQQADSGEDAELKKFINDFHSLYLNRKVQYDPKTVACGASLVRLMYELMISGMGWDKVKQALEIEKKLGMEHLSGPEKGQKIRELRNQFIQEFGKDSVIPASTLKGKDLKRVFWAIVNIDNLNKIEGMI